MEFLTEKLKSLKSKNYKTILLLYSIVEMILCSGLIFGWASLAYILKKEKYFDEFCAYPAISNSSATVDIVYCSSQEDRLNMAYTVAFLTVGVISFPVGSLLDSFGPKVSRVVGCVLFTASAVLWDNLSSGNAYLLYPVLITMASAGVFSSYAFLQVTAFFCDKHQSTTISIQIGAFNASAVILQVIKILYEAQSTLGLERLLAIYCGFCALLVLITTILLIPSKAQLIQHLADRSLINENFLFDTSKEPNANMSIECLAKDQLTQSIDNIPAYNIKSSNFNIEHELMPLPEKTDSQDLLEQDNAVRIMIPSFKNSVIEDYRGSWLSLQGRNSLTNLTEMDGIKRSVLNVILHRSILSIATQCEAANEKENEALEMPEVKQKSITKILFSGIYIWHLIFSSVCAVRLYFYVSTFESMLTKLTDSDENSVNKYINILGVAQFVGMIFTPVLGLYIDRDPKLSPDATYDDYKQWKLRRCAIALFITNSVDAVMGIAVLIPYSQAQVISIAAHVILRGFFYAVHFTYFAAVFPPEHYGKLSCLSLLIAVIFGTLQYPFCILVKERLHNNPFWVNFGLLAVTLAVYGQPLHLIRKKCDNLWNERGSETQGEKLTNDTEFSTKK